MKNKVKRIEQKLNYNKYHIANVDMDIVLNIYYTVLDEKHTPTKCSPVVANYVLENLQIILQKILKDFDLKTKYEIHQKITSMFVQQKFVHYFSDL
jgi:uncharacterized protein YbcV (DUF1398 family)